MRRHVPVLMLLAVLGALSCVSDRELVSRSQAAHHYEAGRCALDCCVRGTGVWVAAAAGADGKPVPAHVVPCVNLVDAPATCPAWKKSLNDLDDEVTLANDTQTIGPLPKTARKRLDGLSATVQKEGQP